MQRPSEFKPNWHPRRNQRGVTLIEMLVSVLILSACMALVSGIAFQVSKVLSASQAQDRSSLTSFMLHHQVVDAALQRLMVGRNTDALGMTGDAMRLQWVTSMDPFHTLGGQTQMRLELVPVAGSTQVHLVAAGRAPTVVLATAQSAKWRYIDESSNAHSTWPPDGMDLPPKMPRSVVLQGPDQRVLAQWVLSGPTRAHPSLGFDPGSFAGQPAR